MATNGTNGERNKDLEDLGVHLSQIKSSGAVTISPELFEKVIPYFQVSTFTAVKNTCEGENTDL
jgi:hypothetical protein